MFRIGQGRGRRFGAVLLGLLAVVWVGSAGAIVFDSRRFIQLFVWRFAPYIDVMMQVMVAGTVARLLLTPRAPLRMSRASLGLTLGGGVALAIADLTREASDGGVARAHGRAVGDRRGAARRAAVACRASSREFPPCSRASCRGSRPPPRHLPSTSP